jgi:type II secretory pathway predicted ATPase ExeA
MCRYELLDLLGFPGDPFKGVKHETADALRVRRILKMAVADHAMISIVGDRGIGKTTAIKDALSDISATLVFVDPADRERIAIGDVEKEMILALSDEKPKAGRVVRSKQLRRIVGEAGRKNEVVLVIEEAHRLHGQTLRSLKTLREMEWMGERDLFTVVFAGQSDPMRKAGVSEVRLRSDSIYMQGLTGNEIRAYISDTVGSLFDSDVIEEVVGIPGTRNFLDLRDRLYALMARAVAGGRDRVVCEDVVEEFGKGLSKPVQRDKSCSKASRDASAIGKVLGRRSAGNKELTAV